MTCVSLHVAGCKYRGVKIDAYENTRKCGELKLYFSPSARGWKKKKKKNRGVKTITCGVWVYTIGPFLCHQHDTCKNKKKIYAWFSWYSITLYPTVINAITSSYKKCPTYTKRPTGFQLLYKEAHRLPIRFQLLREQMRINTHLFCILQVPTTQLSKMSIDLKFVALTADVLEICLWNANVTWNPTKKTTTRISRLLVYRVVEELQQKQQLVSLRQRRIEHEQVLLAVS